ncbi:MAG: succinate dehydrogenase, cytochrome b556 subunit [Rhodospirillales bacterium]|nr:succinate dehydrogenase, cytochrome b556 subunit [Rhodospirillales bacterium]MDE2200212.1 succinate dehydrogenase, cytochrome b556 subunit [Rhodospirillales bacterium]MDE2576172.1 succinate dehydrogenase, cytochrome b556 subunit [Rhodospirillales bacterium]
MKDVREALMLGRASDGKPVRRPLSPHLQIYRPQITSALSIFHRITGVALAAGTLLLVWWLAAAAGSDAAYATVSGFLRSPIGYLLLFGWTVALWYHFCSGLRHLAWDAGRGFELAQVHASGKLVLVATAVLTVATWVIGLAAL